MLHKTRGIVLRHTKYGETSIIPTVYTEEFGVQSYIVNGIRSSRAKRNIIDFSPLSLLDMVVYQKQNRDIQRISDWKRLSHQTGILTNVRKSSIALFLSEILYKSIREIEPSPELFEFVFHSVEWLEEEEKSYSDFHIRFLLKLTRYLGFGLDHYVADPSMIKFQEISRQAYGALDRISREERREHLERIVLYYREHIDGFGQVKSLSILQEVFDE